MDERSRLEEFRQMKNGIRGSGKYLVVGVDVAKMRHHAFFGISAGRTLMKNLVFENTQEGFDKLLFHTETIRKQHALDAVVFGMEPTADYHKPLGEYLIRKGYMTVLVLGNAVKKNRELLDGRWDKHDTKDAANVADLVAQGKCLFYEFPSEDIQQIRSFLSLQHRLKKLEHGLKTRIRNHLIAQYFPELDRYFKYAEVLAITKNGLDPRCVSRLPLEEFTTLVASRRGSAAQKVRIREIWNMAHRSIGSAAYEAATFEATLLVEYLTAIRAMVRTVDGKLHELCSSLPEYTCLLSIPGFGPEISAMVIGTIGNPLRFENTRQVLKTAGLDLSSSRSGKRSDTPYVISKRGKAHLRYALYQAALIASTQNRYFMQYFTNKLTGRQRERGIGTKMRVKLSAKMLVIAWTLMKKKEVFDPGYITL
jgi:transposase